MRYSLYIIILIIFFFQEGVNAYHTHEVSSSVNKIVFEIVDGLILLPLTVDGVPGTYILDSGAPTLVLNQSIEESTATFTAVGQDIPAEETMVGFIQLGSIKVDQVVAWKMDLAFVEQIIERPISGLLGAEFLSQHDVIIDYEMKEISFITVGSDFESLSLSSTIIPISFEIYNENLPVVEIAVDGIKRKMIFDTGAGVNVLHSTNSDSTIKFYSIQSDLLSVLEAQFAETDLGHLSHLNGYQLDGILSVSSLNASKVLISFGRKTIYLFYNDDRGDIALR